MSDKVLVTGVAGFIGSNLAPALLERGYTVAGIDNFSHGHELNLESFRDHPRFTLYRADLGDEAALARAAAGARVIVHLAALKIPRYSDALDTLIVNSRSSEAVARAALENRAKLVIASTSDVYGKNPEIPFHEDSALVIGGPEVKRWSYAISKMFEEQLVFAYHQRHGIRVVVLRLFGGYGPNQDLTWWGGPQSVFINCALDDKVCELHGDGRQTRTFTYVSDHVAGFVAAVEREAADNRVINLGGTGEIAIEDLARLVWRLVRGDQTPRITLLPYSTFGRYEDVRRRVPDVSRARELLGFGAKVDLETGLRRTIRWQLERRLRLGIATPGFEHGLERPPEPA